MRTAYIALLAIALFGGVVMCSEDEMPDYGGDDDYGGGEDDYGGGGGGDEDAPPPDSSSLRELTTVRSSMRSWMITMPPSLALSSPRRSLTRRPPSRQTGMPTRTASGRLL